MFFPLMIWNSYFSFSHLVCARAVSYLCFRFHREILGNLFGPVWECYVLGWSLRMCVSGGERLRECEGSQETHLCPFSVPARGLFFVLPRAIRRVKCDLLFGFHLASWTAADLITAHCVHTHKPISTLQDKQQMQILLCRVTVIQVNLRPGRDINSSVPHRWKMYTFPRHVWVPVASERVGFTPCLTSFRALSLLTQPRTETTGADWMWFD